MIHACNVGPNASVYRYSTSQILDAGDSLEVTLRADRRGEKMCFLLISILRALDDLESGFTDGFSVKTQSNRELNCYLIPASSCCHILEQDEVGGNRHRLSV